MLIELAGERGGTSLDRQGSMVLLHRCTYRYPPTLLLCFPICLFLLYFPKQLTKVKLSLTAACLVVHAFKRPPVNCCFMTLLHLREANVHLGL